MQLFRFFLVLQKKNTSLLTLQGQSARIVATCFGKGSTYQPTLRVKGARIVARCPFLPKAHTNHNCLPYGLKAQELLRVVLSFPKHIPTMIAQSAIIVNRRVGNHDCLVKSAIIVALLTRRVGNHDCLVKSAIIVNRRVGNHEKKTIKNH